MCIGKPIRAQLLFFFCLLHSIISAVVGQEWKLYKVDGRDYVSFDQVATFYQLSRPISLSEKKVLLSNETTNLQFAVGSREALINGIKHWLSFPVLENQGDLLLSRTDLSKTIEPLLRPEHISPKKKVQTVIIDPGHGGDDHGARSRWTKDEKHLTLEVAQHLRNLLLRDQFRVVMTRTRDYFVPLERRAQETLRHRDAIFVSIHFNYGKPYSRGTEVFALTPRGAPSTGQSRISSTDYIRLAGHAFDTHSILLADCVERRIAPLLGIQNSRGVKRARFHVLRESWCPAVLVEGGFLSNRYDAEIISKGDYVSRFAGAIRQAIHDYINLIEGRRTYLTSLP